jgi:hypothetical protein
MYCVLLAVIKGCKRKNKVKFFSGLGASETIEHFFQ